MEGILINISNHPTLPLKRKVEVFCFKPDWRGEGSVEVFLAIKHYQKNEDDSYGEKINSPSISDYEDKLTASNVRKVDPFDGMECYSEIQNEGTEQEETVWKRMDTNVIVPTPIGQFTFFDTIIRNYPVKVGEMLQHFATINDVLKGRWNK